MGKGANEQMGQGVTDPLKMGRWYRLARAVVGFLIRLLARLEVEGLEHVPDRGPYLLVSNHLHWLDPPVLGVVLPHRSYVFAAEKWEHHWLIGPLMRSFNAIFVRRGEVDRKALRQALTVLKAGGVLGLAPEGTRSKTGGLQQGRHGASYMAYRAGVPLLPAVVYGQEKVFPSLRRLRRATVRVVFGPPFEPPPIEGKAGAEEIHALTQETMYRLAALLPPEYRGVYGDVTEKRPDLCVYTARRE
ncbi:MAG TPA: 1-acyl-sn-glycerol-3-phosphate acyltransferase [Anaerolineae bacterium]|nr:1-acyl-sn-glycerol-3-phosphate acyltransferase [Anaerolineae bacterium]